MNFFSRLFGGKPRVVKMDLTKRFDLISRVGQGSMSRVWRARDNKSGRTVALKVLDKVKTKKYEARFKGLNKPTEGEIALTLQHPHVAQTYEHGITIEDEQYLVMEFVEGVGLSFLVDVQNETMRKHRLPFMIQLGQAIQYFHDNRWIHRDLCPRNIMVNNDNQIKLIDFGLTVPNLPPFKQPGNRTGTANYMAPELIRRLKTDHRIDIFSYAITCFEMYTRRLPWENAETLEAVLQHVNNPADNIRDHMPGIDPQVADAIMKGLERNPDDRFAVIDDMIAEFQQALDRLRAHAESR